MQHKVTKEEADNISRLTEAVAKLQSELDRTREDENKELARLKKDIAELQQLRSGYMEVLAKKYAALEPGTEVEIYRYAIRSKTKRRRRAKTTIRVGAGRVWRPKYFDKFKYVSYDLYPIRGAKFDHKKHYLKVKQTE